MNIYLSKTEILQTIVTYNKEADAEEMLTALLLKVSTGAADHAVREVFDYLNVKDLKVMINRLLEVGLMIKEIDNE